MSTNHHQRSALLREIDRNGTWHRVPGLWESFADEDDLLRAAQQAWFTSLGSAIDLAIETGNGELADDVRSAYRSVAKRHPGLRRLLDQHAHHASIEHAVRREHALLARAAGVAHSSEVIPASRPVAAEPRPAQPVTVPRPRGLLSRMFQPA